MEQVASRKLQVIRGFEVACGNVIGYWSLVIGKMVCYVLRATCYVFLGLPLATIKKMALQSNAFQNHSPFGQRPLPTTHYPLPTFSPLGENRA
jgi:hypothetical protein